jgi:RNA polymerase sigma-70 factor, ECF subfamily
METEQVQAAIQELPIPFREIILLRVYEELWYQEIAGILDFPVGIVIHVWESARCFLQRWRGRIHPQ